MTSSPGPMPAASKRKVQGACSRVHTNTVFRLAQGRELLFERCNLTSQCKLAAVQHALNRSIDLVFDARVLRLQVDEWNHVLFARR